jgi:hypothetical protein
MRSGKPDVSPNNELYSQSAIYVAATHVLKPNTKPNYLVYFVLAKCLWLSFSILFIFLLSSKNLLTLYFIYIVSTILLSTELYMIVCRMLILLPCR